MGFIGSIEPPYIQIAGLQLRDLPTIRPGSVVVIKVRDPGRLCPRRLRRLISWIHRRVDTAIAIHMESPTSSDSLRVAMYAYYAGARAIIIGDEPIRPALWKYLADPLDVAGDLASWVRRRRRVSNDVIRLVEGIVREAPRHGSFKSLLAHLDVPPRTLRHALDAAKLPEPSKWYHLGRHLYAQTRLLRDPGFDVADVARELGYADRMSFTNRVYRMFGFTAEKSRQLLGWEWRFAHWWRRAHDDSKSDAAEFCRAGF